jgi:hypothetical protein
MTKESKMKKTKLFGGLILLMLLSMAGSTYGYMDPLNGHNDVIGINEPGSDHPWGGEGGSGSGGGPDLVIIFIGTPIPIVNIFQLIQVFNTSNDIRTIRNDNIIRSTRITRVNASSSAIRSTILRGN